MFEQHDDAIDLLKRDHRELEKLFVEFARAGHDNGRIDLAQRICTELSIHAKVEEELFYPAARDALGDDNAALVAEATVEHAGLKHLIAQIDGSSPADEMFEARMKVLKEYVQHHVREEEMRLMPAVRRASIDLDSLGDRIAQRKHALAERVEFVVSPGPGKNPLVKVPEVDRAGARSRAGATNQPARRKTKTREIAERDGAARARATKKHRATGKRESNPGAQRRALAKRKA
jgi:hypothetical protein